MALVYEFFFISLCLFPTYIESFAVMINVIQHVKGAQIHNGGANNNKSENHLSFEFSSRKSWMDYVLSEIERYLLLLSSALFMNFHFGLICCRHPMCNNRMKQMEVHGKKAAKWKRLNYNFEFKTINCINCSVFYSIQHASFHLSLLSVASYFPMMNEKKAIVEHRVIC